MIYHGKKPDVVFMMVTSYQAYHVFNDYISKRQVLSEIYKRNRYDLFTQIEFRIYIC